MNTLPVRIENVPQDANYKPLDHSAYYKELGRFLLYAGIIASLLALSGALLVLGIVLLIPLLILFPFMFGALLFAIFLQVWDAHKYAKTDIQVTRINETKLQFMWVEIQQNIQIEKVEVRKGGTFISSPTLPQAQPPKINDTYTLALRIAHVGIESWRANGNKRPKPKPISATAITEMFKVGREAWQEAIALLGESKLFEHPETESKWKPLCTNMEEAMLVLNSHMQRDKGLFLTSYEGKQVWMPKGN